ITRSRNHGLMMAGIFSVLAVLMGLLLTRSIVKPLQLAANISDQLAQGVMKEIQLDTLSRDETGQMLKSMQNMVANFRGMVGKVTITAEQVQSLTNSIAEAVTEEVTSATQQSAAVSEITASMEELSATSNQISENAASVLSVAAQTLEVAEQGRNAAEQVMQKMREINEENQKNINEVVELGKKSQEINKVMVIINRIADQTKLIAFNAAIEASSAGEAGTRFGVVAVEIRRLADSVMESTSEISENLQEIQEGVNRLVVASEKGSKGIREGSELTEGTAHFLDEILSGAQATNDSAKQISLSTQQQKTATAQVVVALREIEDGSQLIANSVNKTNDTCNALMQLSNNLSEHINRFKLN
ncbi:MAG: methyl-accepting chemotaxis protein, partial [Magnetococcus sp. DMHC-8]